MDIGLPSYYPIKTNVTTAATTYTKPTIIAITLAGE